MKTVASAPRPRWTSSRSSSGASEQRCERQLAEVHRQRPRARLVHEVRQVLAHERSVALAVGVAERVVAVVAAAADGAHERAGELRAERPAVDHRHARGDRARRRRRRRAAPARPTRARPARVGCARQFKRAAGVPSPPDLVWSYMDEVARNVAAIQRAWDAFNRETITTRSHQPGQVRGGARGVRPRDRLGRDRRRRARPRRVPRPPWRRPVLAWTGSRSSATCTPTCSRSGARATRCSRCAARRGSGIASGAAVTWDFAMVFTMRDGKAVRMKMYAEHR